MSASPGARITRLEALLRAEGLSCARAEVAGHDGDVAVVCDAEPERVRPIADRIRAIGFRYVTVGLESGTE